MTIQIGPYRLSSQVFLAPMAGVTDKPFRELCLQFGAGLATSEMLTAQSALWQSVKSQQRLRFSSLGLRSVQIAGSEPDQMAAAAQQVVELGAQIVDINMGCPAKKVCKKAAGSSLLKDEVLVKDILQAVVESVAAPVTLKIRTGWSPETRNAVNIANIAEQSGIQMLAVHGRTRACGYKNTVEYDSIAEVVQAVAIPVIANGDICSAEDALQVLDKTAAQGVMIGRGAFGQPWLFQQINDVLKNQCRVKSGSYVGDIDISYIIVSHIKAMHDFYGHKQGLRIARKHIGWYLERLGFDVSTKKQLMKIDDTEQQISVLKQVLLGAAQQLKVA